MLIVISPAKTLDFENINTNLPMSSPRFLKNSNIIMNELRELDSYSIGKLMKISDKLSSLNKDRFTTWQDTLENSKHCLLAFQGDVYKGLDVGSFTDEDLFYANDHLRILSGLYGVLRPFDGINPYRLEMGSKLKVLEEKNLYEFWKDTLKKSIHEELLKHDESTLINLASKEYFKAVEAIEKEKDVRVITPMFKEFRNGEYKIISLKAKRARGIMSRYIIQNQINSPEKLKEFNEEEYEYNEELSSENEWIFTR
ncbi:MAG: peroxide stress protein YaaA [Clostridium sp.]